MPLGLCARWVQLEADTLCSLAQLFSWAAAVAIQLCGSICCEAAGQGLSAAVHGVGAGGKAQGEKQEKDSSLSSAFPAEFSHEITFTSYPGNTDFKADKSNKT